MQPNAEGVFLDKKPVAITIVTITISTITTTTTTTTNTSSRHDVLCSER